VSGSKANRAAKSIDERNGKENAREEREPGKQHKKGKESERGQGEETNQRAIV
jgi:hypothetical protein